MGDGDWQIVAPNVNADPSAEVIEMSETQDTTHIDDGNTRGHLMLSNQMTVSYGDNGDESMVIDENKINENNKENYHLAVQNGNGQEATINTSGMGTVISMNTNENDDDDKNENDISSIDASRNAYVRNVMMESDYDLVQTDNFDEFALHRSLSRRSSTKNVKRRKSKKRVNNTNHKPNMNKNNQEDDDSNDSDDSSSSDEDGTNFVE